MLFANAEEAAKEKYESLKKKVDSTPLSNLTLRL